VTGYDVIYDGAAHTATGSCKGVLGETLSGLDLSGTIHTNASGILGYWDSWSFTDVTGNYNDDGGLVFDRIDKAPSVTTVTCPAGPYIYTGLPQTPCSATVTGAGGLSLTPTPDYSNNTNAGTATASYTYAGDLNHTGSSDSKNFTINKALLTVTADNQSIIFGQPLPTFTFQYSGFVNGEGSSVVDTAPTCGVGSIPMYGTYPITCSGGLDNNYAFYYVNGTLTVQAWTIQGFFQPVDMGNVWNTVKNGSTVPLKFKIFAGTTELTDVSAVKSLLYKQVACTTLPGAVEDAIETLAATGSTVLRYDTTGGQFVFNWKTPTTPGKCYQVTMTALDGSSITAFFKLR
jgi:hypothetical protein